MNAIWSLATMVKMGNPDKMHRYVRKIIDKIKIEIKIRIYRNIYILFHAFPVKFSSKLFLTEIQIIARWRIPLHIKIQT